MYTTLDEGAAPDSPFVAIGGSAAVAGAVDELYRRLMADPVTAPAFASFPTERMAALKRHQVLLLTRVLGGPDQYDGRDLRTAHADLGIDATTYQRVSLHLITVLHDLGVPMDILQTADSTLHAVAPDIVAT